MEWIKYLFIAVLVITVILFAVHEFNYYFGPGISGQGAIQPNQT